MKDPLCFSADIIFSLFQLVGVEVPSGATAACVRPEYIARSYYKGYARTLMFSLQCLNNAAARPDTPAKFASTFFIRSIIFHKVILYLKIVKA